MHYCYSSLIIFLSRTREILVCCSSIMDNNNNNNEIFIDLNAPLPPSPILNQGILLLKYMNFFLSKEKITNPSL